MNYSLLIVNKTKKPFSGIKDNSPKMYNKMVEISKQYSIMFKEEYKVKRVILTKSGYKFI
jgi:hypothetical protein